MCCRSISTCFRTSSACRRSSSMCYRTFSVLPRGKLLWRPVTIYGFISSIPSSEGFVRKLVVSTTRGIMAAHCWLARLVEALVLPFGMDETDPSGPPTHFPPTLLQHSKSSRGVVYPAPTRKFRPASETPPRPSTMTQLHRLINQVSWYPGAEAGASNTCVQDEASWTPHM